MMEKDIEKTSYYSYRLGSLPKGCKLCVRGEKLVLVITGLCGRDCFYCPLSDEKKNKDVVYANEWNVGYAKGELEEKHLKVIVEEARLCEAKGAGVTGGDPLLVAERSVEAIKRLKKEFGKNFHVHLYTMPESVTEKKLKLLYDAGLDEIRFHPKVWDDSDWKKLAIARKFDWSIGAEIPAIPGYEKETRKLIDYLAGKVSFLNINELELADTRSNKLLGMGYTAKDELSYGVSGSEQMALDLMNYVKEKGYSLRVHYCTCKLKDAVQMASRIKRRAKNVAYGFDKITSEGMLLRSAIYLKETKPSFSYRKILKEMGAEERADLMRKLVAARDRLITEIGFKEEEVKIDDYKLRLIAAPKIVTKNSKLIKRIGLYPALVEEYPTRDGLEVDVEFL
jgi:hypothetical protein